MTATADPTARYAARFTARFPGRLAQVRELALARFQERGFPSTDDEEWRFTPLGALRDTEFTGSADAPVAEADLARWTFGDAFDTRVVVVNGRYAAATSRVGALPAGVRVESLAGALATGGPAAEHIATVARFENRPLTALNTALFEDGVFIVVPRNAVVEDTIHIVHVASAPGDPVAAHPRTLIVAGESSQVRVVESYVGAGRETYFSNPVTEVVVAPGALVEHCRVQRDSESAFHIGDLSVKIGRDATFTSHSVTLGGAIARCDVNAVLHGEGVACTLNGLYIGDGTRLVDNHTEIDHAQPHCESHELYKGILSGQSRGVFNGKIMVRPDAQKTDAKQTNRALLLSDQAQINTKPQLEIFADDVRCTHGATVGQLDEDALFYLRSRGIDREAARALLVYAFAGDIVERIPIEPLREELRALLLARLPVGSR